MIADGRIVHPIARVAEERRLALIHSGAGPDCSAQDLDRRGRRASIQSVAIETQNIKGHERGPPAAPLG